MSSAFDQLPAFSFGGVQFPYITYKVQGGLRDKVHEYPHSPGGAPEKLGRKLYEVSVTADFMAGAIKPKYRDLWPGHLATLRGMFEQQVTAELHVPTVGTFQAYCVDWDEEARNQRRNGVAVSMKFREDQPQEFGLFVEQDTLGTALQDFEIAIEEREITTDLFDGIVGIANAVLGIKDQLDLYGSLVASKIGTLTSLCDQADRQLNELDSLEFQNVRDALHELWLSATKLQRTANAQTDRFKTFTTPIQMPISAVARHLGIENPADIMLLNPLRDPMAIPANTVLRYIAAA